MNNDPPFTITEEMLNLVAEISETLGSIKSVGDMEKLPRLRRVGRIMSIHSSLAIENNSLTVDQVTDIIDGKRIIGPPKEIHEVKNAFAAYEELESIDPYDMKELLRIHGIMMGGLISESGRFRTVNAGVFSSDGRVVHAAPPPGMVPELMSGLFEWLRASKVHVLIRSSVFHYEFEFIHPFRDGNGRTGRLWQTAVLMKWMPVFAWIPVESVIRDRQTEYYDAISGSTSAGNSNEFILFMLRVILDAVKGLASDTQKHINHIDTRVRELLAAMEPYPMSATELMERLGLRSRDAFRENYLKPAVEAGLISLTEPDKPTSRNQRYFRK
ncbi:MAG: Fic family protein [Candidatus Methanoplasma sp.]|jgi:Fic family protein|nr:Fic family protein [Candidatus Methanoplasma sp.]